MNERVDWFADRADASASDDPPSATKSIDENAATDANAGGRAAVSPSPIRPIKPVDDEQMTLTIVELDMLRQDYEAEHTLTQQASQALRDALADLKATKAARAASAETATLESPQLAESETADSAAISTTLRVRMK